VTRKTAHLEAGPFATASDPMSEAEYQASLQALDAERAALKNDYVTSQTYPRWAYHATEPDRLVYSDAEALALGPGWSPTPLDTPPAAPTLTALEPDTAVLGSPDFVLHLHGTGFTLQTVIVFAGQDEPTTVLSDTEVTTGVDMSVWLGADPAVPVFVRTLAGGDSNVLPFAFTDAGATTAKKARAR
jgi:hypothetical protein